MSSRAPSQTPLRALHSLTVSLRDLPHELGPGHVHGAVDDPRLRPRIVLEDFNHQRGVVGEYYAGLQHAHKTDLSLGLAEGSGRVDCHIGVEAFANGGDGKWSLANPDFIA